MQKNIFILDINDAENLSSKNIKKSDIIFTEKSNVEINIPFNKNLSCIDLNTKDYNKFKEEIKENNNVCIILDTFNNKEFIDKIISDSNFQINIDKNILNYFISNISSYKVINALNKCIDKPDTNCINIITNIKNNENFLRVKNHLLKYFNKKVNAYVIRNEKLEKIMLNDLNSKDEDFSHTTIIIDKQNFLMTKKSIDSFMELIEYLRSDKGCPWDRKQTHETLTKHLLEETYEVIDAINNKNIDDIKEELGDLLLQIALHCQIELENKNFDIEDVIESINNKIIRRHPYVFDNAVLENEDTSKIWNEVKKEEKSYTNFTQTMNSVPKVFPALLYAEKIQKRAKNANFEFKDYKDALKKVYEELDEFENEINKNENNLFIEAGDLLFSIVNTLRLLDINSEEALKSAVNKFIQRFSVMEELIINDKYDITKLESEFLEKYWEKAKFLLK